jgi:hypothetical protein
MAVKSVIDIVEVATQLLDQKPVEKQTEDEKVRNLQCATMFLAMGESMEMVARKFRLDPMEFATYVRSEQGMDLLIRLQSGMFSDPAERVKRMQHMALDTMTKLLFRATDATQAKVAADILDRGGGKAVQRIETRSTISVTDIAKADEVLVNQSERLARLEEKKKLLLSARKSPPKT